MYGAKNYHQTGRKKKMDRNTFGFFEVGNKADECHFTNSDFITKEN
jgi:hypothetical protein